MDERIEFFYKVLKLIQDALLIPVSLLGIWKLYIETYRQSKKTNDTK